MKKRLTLKGMLVLFALIPLTVGVIILSTISTIAMISNLQEKTLDELKSASKGLLYYYEYDLKNNLDLENGFLEYAPEDYIDLVKRDTDVDLTVFQGDTRYMTSLRNADGSRNEGTKASSEVWATVKSGDDFTSTDVVINGVDYYVYYTPLKDGDNNIVGMAFAGKSANEVNRSVKTIIAFMIFAGIALEGIFVIIAMLISKKVSSPINEVAGQLAKLSDGDTDVDVHSESHIAETIVLIESLMSLRDSLKEIVGKINTNMSELNDKITTTTENANNVSSDMRQISDSMTGLASSTQMLAENVQDINTNVLKMGDIVANTVSTVETLKQSTSVMTEANSGAMECINDISDSSNKSVEAVEQISQSVMATNGAVDKINEMVSIITSIANQTRLLSLNASIEAARAGEAGRGFAVVAEEISKLASESNDSATEIRNTVSEITGLSKSCVEHVEKVKKTIDAEQQLLNNALGQFEALNIEITNSVGGIEEVAGVTSQLGDIKDTIISAVTDLSAISEETSATNEEVTATAETVSGSVNEVSEDMTRMNELSEELSKAVSFFKI